VTRPATVGGDGSIRLFCALLLPDEILDALVAWQRELPAAHGVRPVARANLHVTLAFLGHLPREKAAGVAAALRAAAAGAGELVLRPRRYRETRSVGMLVLDDEAGRAGRLALDLHDRLERLGVYRRERRPWLAHVTVLRFRSPPRLAPGVLDLGLLRPSDAALYHSVLRPTGAQYEVLERVALGG
jgi:RNA 2',3'-cyclic 3'-phosphodiesterase